jgi:hypothetical protein
VIRLVRGAVLTARGSTTSAARTRATAGRVPTCLLRNIPPTVIVYSTLFMANAIS